MGRSVILAAMSLRQQQVTVFCATVVVIFGILGVGIWLDCRATTTETTLQTALLMARQVEIALADSLRERSIVVQPRQGQKAQSSFWDFLGNLLPGRSTGSSSGPIRYTPSRQAEVKGLMQAFLDRSASIEAMWVVNAEGRLLYSSIDNDKDKTPISEAALRKATPRRDGHRYQERGKGQLL